MSHVATVTPGVVVVPAELPGFLLIVVGFPCCASSETAELRGSTQLVRALVDVIIVSHTCAESD